MNELGFPVLIIGINQVITGVAVFARGCTFTRFREFDACLRRRLAALGLKATVLVPGAPGMKRLEHTSFRESEAENPENPLAPCWRSHSSSS